MINIMPLSLHFAGGEEKIKSIITNNKLWPLTYGQTETPKEEFKVDPLYTYLGIYWDHEIIGLFQYKSLNGYTCEGHIFILSKFWGSGASQAAVKSGHDYIVLNTKFRTVYTTVPLSCAHIHKFMEQIHYKVSGTIPLGVVYNSKLQDLIIYTKHLEED